jgi:hypothetical protein
MLWITGIDRFIDKIEPDELKKADKDWFYDELLTYLGARLSQNNNRHGDVKISRDRKVYDNNKGERFLIISDLTYSAPELRDDIERLKPRHVIFLRAPRGANSSKREEFSEVARTMNMAFVTQQIPNNHSLEDLLKPTPSSVSNTSVAQLLTINTNKQNSDNVFINNSNGGVINININTQKSTKFRDWLSGLLTSILANIITGGCPILQAMCN